MLYRRHLALTTGSGTARRHDDETAISVVPSIRRRSPSFSPLYIPLPFFRFRLSSSSRSFEPFLLLLLFSPSTHTYMYITTVYTHVRAYTQLPPVLPSISRPLRINSRSFLLFLRPPLLSPCARSAFHSCAHRSARRIPTRARHPRTPRRRIVASVLRALHRLLH